MFNSRFPCVPRTGGEYSVTRVYFQIYTAGNLIIAHACHVPTKHSHQYECRGSSVSVQEENRWV